MAGHDVIVRVFRPLWEDMQRAFARVALELGWGPWRVGPRSPIASFGPARTTISTTGCSPLKGNSGTS